MDPIPDLRNLGADLGGVGRHAEGTAKVGGCGRFHPSAGLRQPPLAAAVGHGVLSGPAGQRGAAAYGELRPQPLEGQPGALGFVAGARACVADAGTGPAREVGLVAWEGPEYPSAAMAAGSGADRKHGSLDHLVRVRRPHDLSLQLDDSAGDHQRVLAELDLRAAPPHRVGASRASLAGDAGDVEPVCFCVEAHGPSFASPGPSIKSPASAPWFPVRRGPFYPLWPGHHRRHD